MKAYLPLVVLLLFPSLLPTKLSPNQYRAKQSQGSQQARNHKHNAAEPVAPNVERPESTQIQSEPSIRQKRDKADPPKNRWVELINAGSTLVIAFFAMVTAWLAWIQIRTLKGVERPWAVAWVDHEAFKLAVEQGLSEIPIVVTCKNFGRTPVWIESTGIRTWTGLEEEFKPPWDVRWTQRSETVLAPNSPDSFMQQVSIISRQDYVEMTAGVRAGFVYGIVIYRDAADDSHITRFCYRYRFVGIAGGQPIEGFYAEGPNGYNKHT